MAKRKCRLIKVNTPYSPIIAIMGGKHHTDYMPKDYGVIVPTTKRVDKPSTKVVRKRVKGYLHNK